MATRDIVVIGASAGGIDALKILVAPLPKNLKAAIFITLHVAPYSDGILPEILERAGASAGVQCQRLGTNSTWPHLRSPPGSPSSI